jgi:heme oxygenase
MARAARGSRDGVDDILAALRAATAPLHSRLDAALDFAPERTSPARYGGFLRATLALVEPLEASFSALPAFAALLPDLPLRRKAALLHDDLRSLGVDPGAAARGLPSIGSAAAAFGAAYVLEGSTLGGAVLARQLGPALGLTPNHGMRYFHAYGAELGAYWKRFVTALQAFGSGLDAAAEAELLATASAIFAAFQREFEATGVIVRAAAQP